MTNVLLLTESPTGALPEWADASLHVMLLEDPLALPFRLLAEPVDVVVSPVALPAEIGAIEVPSIWQGSLPKDPRLTRALLHRLARHPVRRSAPLGRLAEGLNRLLAEVEDLAGGRMGSDLFETRSAPPSWVADSEPAALTAPPDLPLGAPLTPTLSMPGIPLSVSVTILAAPALRLPDIEELVDALEALPGLHIRFRLFRDGVYRVDGLLVEEQTSLLAALRMLPGVVEVAVDLDRITLTLGQRS